jgi:hypothetical protein
MALVPPVAADDPPPRDVVTAFARFGADWTRTRAELPQRRLLCSEGTGPVRQPKGRGPGSGSPGVVGDRWLRMEYAGLLLAFVQRLRLDAGTRRAVTDALRNSRFGTVPLPTTVRALVDGREGAPRQAQPLPLVRRIGRTGLPTDHRPP